MLCNPDVEDCDSGIVHQDLFQYRDGFVASSLVELGSHKTLLTQTKWLMRSVG